MTGTALPLDAWLASRRALVEQALARAVDGAGVPPPLADAMRYSLLAGGKRLRPMLVLGAAEACGVPLGLAPEAADALALPAACAIEFVHTYSLIHDDLPAMDNDTMRRGRPTSHVVHGEALAILAGDALLTEAFALLARDPEPPAGRPDGRARPEGRAYDEPAAPRPGLQATHAAEPVAASADLVRRRLRALRVIADAAGPAGMVGGQVLDLRAADPGAGPLDADGLRDMHTRKTGALIRGSVLAGALIAGADEPMLAALEGYGDSVGLAFQIVDDILDVEGASAELGKTAGKDAVAGKPTYPALYGLEPSRRLAASCLDRALEALRRADLGGQLPAIARWVVSRTQ